MRHTRFWRDWSSDVCSSDLAVDVAGGREERLRIRRFGVELLAFRNVKMPFTEAGRKQRAARSAEAGQRDVDQLLPVYRVTECEPDVTVLEQGVAARLRVVRHVDADVVE